MQINASSILGKYGWLMKRKANRLIREGWCQVVASDAHHLSDIRYSLGRVRPVLAKQFGEAMAAELVVDNPEKIMGGELIYGR